VVEGPGRRRIWDSVLRMMTDSAAGTRAAILKQLEAASELRSAGLLTEAVDMLTNPAQYDAYLCTVRAEMEFALGRFQDAALSYFSVTISDPDNSNVHFNLALCLERCGRWDMAAEVFQRVLQLDGERGDACLGLGACLLHLHRAEEALAAFNQCTRGVEPRAALAGKAAALQLLHRFDDAGRAYSELLASDPSSQEALSNLIAMGVETGDLKQVRDYSLLLLDICPQSTVALQGLATVALDGLDHASAAYYCDRILELDPDCLEAWHNFRIAMDQSSFSGSEPILALHTGGKQ
jgi:tetratricopeptide (TPR) repeat protein